MAKLPSRVYLFTDPEAQIVLDALDEWYALQFETLQDDAAGRTLRVLKYVREVLRT